VDPDVDVRVRYPVAPEGKRISEACVDKAGCPEQIPDGAVPRVISGDRRDEVIHRGYYGAAEFVARLLCRDELGCDPIFGEELVDGMLGICLVRVSGGLVDASLDAPLSPFAFVVFGFAERGNAGPVLRDQR
jgi:hypothetical protein